MPYALETQALTKTFPPAASWRFWHAPAPAAQPAVDRVSLQVQAGELFGLVGPNGAGKTTLIKLLATLIIPSAGLARVNGYDLAEQIPIKASIGLVTSDERSFYWRLSGRQNLEFFAVLHHLPAAEVDRRVAETLQTVGLEAEADRRFQLYSTGMRQRLSIARALLSQPRLLFLDEPTKGLDPLGIQELHRLIRDQLTTQLGLTVFLTSHWLEEVEQLCDRIAIMNRGRILDCGTLPELRSRLGLGERYQLQVSRLTPEASESLRGQTPALNLSPKSDGITTLEFQSAAGEETLGKVFDTIYANGGHIRSVIRTAVSLEQIFARLVSMPASGDPPPPSTQMSLNTPPATPHLRKPPSISLRTFLAVAWAFLKRDVREEVSYRFGFLLQFVSIFLSIGVFYFIARLIGEAASPFLEQYGGDYFAFVLIGIAFASYFSVGLTSFSQSLRQAQTTGTLEAMLTTPTGVSTIILSSTIWNYLLTTLRVVVYLGFGGAMLGVGLGNGNYPASVLILFLTILTFSSLGIIAASFIMVLKRGDPVTWLFSAFSSLLGGVYYPVNILPDGLQALAKLLPITYALRAMRLALLQNASFTSLLPDILVLALFCGLLMPISLLAFRYAVTRARIDGSLTHY